MNKKTFLKSLFGLCVVPFLPMAAGLKRSKWSKIRNEKIIPLFEMKMEDGGIALCEKDWFLRLVENDIQVAKNALYTFSFWRWTPSGYKTFSEMLGTLCVHCEAKYNRITNGQFGLWKSEWVKCGSPETFWPCWAPVIKIKEV